MSMSLFSTIDYVCGYTFNIIKAPSTVLFFGVAIILTLKTRFAQFRAFPRFISIVKQGMADRNKKQNPAEKSINAFHALSIAMATTIGMGNIVGPAAAIWVGGPGALFWLIMYIFFASVTKFYEVTFALHTRITKSCGNIAGGPSEYLKLVSPSLAYWYSVVLVVLFMAWSGMQSNTLAVVFAEEGLPVWITAALCALIVFLVLSGGAKRVGKVTSKMVPLMFFLYVGFSIYLLLHNLSGLRDACTLIFSSILSPAAPLGGFAGATIFSAIHMGVYRGIYLSEAGVGTSSIPHAVANTKNPTDQGILALYSMFSDALISTLSGLIVITSGVWTYGQFRNSLVYDAFKLYSPFLGKYILLVTISLFVISTIIGNSFNGTQSFVSLAHNKWLNVYKFFMIMTVFVGAFIPASLMWNITDIMLTLVAIPNVIGILILAFKKPEIAKI